MSTLLNRHEAKRRVMAMMGARRPPLAAQMSRVSNDYLDHLEARVMAWIEADVQRHPSLGHTFGTPLILHHGEKT